jgi:Flp pilus assembly protein TadG
MARLEGVHTSREGGDRPGVTHGGASGRSGMPPARERRERAERRGDRRGDGRGRAERGATVVELALLMPIVLVAVLLIVQMTLWAHGRQVADAAAREGARIARASGTPSGWQGEAENKAEEIVQSIGPQLLSDATATAWENGDERGVNVTGTVVQVVPLLPERTFTITSHFGGPTECFRPDDDSPGCE